MCTRYEIEWRWLVEKINIKQNNIIITIGSLILNDCKATY